MNNEINNAFEEVKEFIVDFFKNPSSIVRKSTSASNKTGMILIITTLIMSAMTSLLWILKNGYIFNIFSNSMTVMGGAISQLISYGLITLILYCALQNADEKLNGFIGILNIVSIAYFPVAIFKFLANIVGVLGINSIISISSALSTAGVVAFGILIYRILTEKEFSREKEAFFITILICFLA